MAIRLSSRACILRACGFGGGFDSKMLNSWGEPLIKSFVQEAVDHSLRLKKRCGAASRSARWPSRTTRPFADG